MRLIGRALLAQEALLALSSGYLLGLLLAAREPVGRLAATPPRRPADDQRFVVLIPAHDEQEGIGATLDSLAACRYPRERLRVVVIADNCTDLTAKRAREVEVEVWERHDPARRGKGFALIWALRRLQSEPSADFDAVIVLDADCLVSSNLPSAIATRLGAGASAAQVNYVVGNPAASHASALRFAAFALMNTVRPLGKQRLGLSCGLFGTGMAFTAELLRREPWTETGLVEDGEYHMRLVHAGERVEFIPEATVSSAMPTSLGASSDQQARWEQGRLQLARRWSPRLIRSGLAERDVVRVHAGLEQLVPPQSLIVAGSLGSALGGQLLGSRRLLSLALAALVTQLTFVLAGLRLVGAPSEAYRALLAAPALVAAKLALYVDLLRGRGPKAWVRTVRP